MKTNLLDGMVIFVHVVDTGSFTNAAQATGHSTSYISKEISKLEERLGVRLMHRTTRTLSLTPEGELYYESCKQLVESAGEVENALGGKQSEPQGHLRISCPVSFGIVELSPMLAKFMAQYPKVTFEVDLSDRKVDLVAEGVDVAVRAVHKAADSSLISRRIKTARSVTVAAPSYLRKYGTPKHPSELSQHKAITYSYQKNPNVWEYSDSDGESIKVDVVSVFSANSPEMEMGMCVEGIGITRLPEEHTREAIATGRLVELFSDLPTQKIDLCLVYPSRKHMSAKVRTFIDFMAENLAAKCTHKIKGG
ncbi:LysR family transcriptional regulator [Vibrio coralliilyticus]|uniref:LysR family transcriptional regulator n=1 Tax=Vibrio coralliilyticus TaxID=190893 RepID=A0A1V0IDJ7_9VIBR|nr:MULTISPECIES: LysR family transcriptional regulator [Vibrio]ARC94220.1 LysR family transcriptional regulator [Vibrio coralliilyticus]KJY70160.1 LysR family transcriptional regulator [Vibrio coralliilyticus]NOJ21195.1 LysR family transcriptional regulator [Vibrio coralliilyticus]QOU32574.1 LysR family transcriptional regulator [Vibrio coralliilyticus]